MTACETNGALDLLAAGMENGTSEGLNLEIRFMSNRCRLVLAFALAVLLLTCHLAQAQPGPVPPGRNPVSKPADPPVSYPLGSDEDLASEQRIQNALAKRITVDWKSLPLQEAISQLADEGDITIVLTKKIADAGVKPDQPVTLKASKLPLRTFLRLILSDLNLTFWIKDEVIKITTVEDAQSPDHLTIRFYPVKDLVNPTRQSKQSAPPLDFEPLIRLIQEIEPDSWRDVGGPGTLIGFDNAACLFISQLPDIHETLGKLLTTLRRVKAVQGLNQPANQLNRYATPEH
jgi:hypothetical protein